MEYQRIYWTGCGGKFHVPGTIPHFEGQREIQQSTVSLLAIDIVGVNMKGNIEEDEEVDGDKKYGMFRNKATRYVWSEYMRVKTCEKRGEDHRNSIS